MKKILVLEDNSATLEYLVALLKEVEIKNDILACTNIKDAYQYALEKDIDLFIIDIILDTSRPGDSSGLQFVDSIRKIERYAFTPVIFVTSLTDERLYSYEKLHCYSFIEKPFDEDRFKKLARECLNFPERKEKKNLFFRKEGIILAVEREDIVYAEYKNRMLDIHTKQKDLLSIPYITLKEFLTDLDSTDFLQCSRNTVVNSNFIHNVDITNRVIQLKEQMGRIEIGIMYKKEIRNIFI